MSEAKPNNGEEFAKNKRTICANCCYPEKFSSNPHCYGTEQEVVEDYVNGGTKREYYNPNHDRYYDTPPFCMNINDGNCSYYKDKSKKPSIVQRISAVLKRGNNM